MFGSHRYSINTKKALFLHYFDIHFIEEHFGNVSLPDKVINEMKVATRIAFLTADKLLVPASSYAESKICKKILNQYSSLFDLYFSFVGKAANLVEFIDSKMDQYGEDTLQRECYNELSQTTIILPFLERQNSSTNDISNSWKKSKQKNEVAEILDRNHKKPYLIDKWKDIPEELGKKAFVVNNVLPLLVPNARETEINLKNKLHEIINKAYFESYLQEYTAGFIDDLGYLSSNSFDRLRNWSISYSNIVKYLKENNLYQKYLKIPVSKLLHLKSEWQKDLILSNEYAIDRERKINDYIKGLSKKDRSKTFNLLGVDIIMGNKIIQEGVKGFFNRVNGDIHQNIALQQDGMSKEDLDEILQQIPRLRDKLASMPITTKIGKDIGSLSEAEEYYKKGDVHNGDSILRKITTETVNTAKTLGLGHRRYPLPGEDVDEAVHELLAFIVSHWREYVF